MFSNNVEQGVLGGTHFFVEMRCSGKVHFLSVELCRFVFYADGEAHNSKQTYIRTGIVTSGADLICSGGALFPV